MSLSSTVPSLYDIVLGSISEHVTRESIDHSLLRSLPVTLLPSIFERCCEDGHLNLSLLIAFRPYFDSFTRISLNQALSQTPKQAQPTRLALNDLVLASILPCLTSLRELDLTRNLSITRLSLPQPELLVSLNISGCRSLKDSQVATLIKQAINLTDIDLSGSGVGDLTVLALSENRSITQQRQPSNIINQSQILDSDMMMSSDAVVYSKVQRLNLSGCLVYHGLKQFLSLRPPVVYLNVSQTWFGADEFELLDLVSDTLTDLNLEFSMKLRDASLIHLHQCRLIQTINLSRNAYVSSQALRALHQMSALRKLVLGGQDVQDFDFSHNRSLLELDLQRSVTFNDRVAMTLIPLSQITQMSLQYTSLSNAFVPFLILSFPHLTQLKLTRTSIDNIGIRALFTPWSVTKSELGQISSIPSHIADFLASTRSIQSEEQFTMNVPVFATTLERLDIGGEKLTDICVAAINEGLVNFTKLSFFGIWTSSITASAIAPLLSQPRARSTYIGGLVNALREEPIFTTEYLYDDDSNSSTASSSPRLSVSDATNLRPAHRYILDPTMNSSVGTYVLVASD